MNSHSCFQSFDDGTVWVQVEKSQNRTVDAQLPVWSRKHFGKGDPSTHFYTMNGGELLTVAVWFKPPIAEARRIATEERFLGMVHFTGAPDPSTFEFVGPKPLVKRKK